MNVRIPVCRLSAAVLLLAAAPARADNGRIELSQSDFVLGAVVITQAGSYVFTENIVCSAPTNGIVISANDVTIDLNGFRLQGPGVSGLHGIVQDFGQKHLVVRNGTINHWQGANKFGIYAQDGGFNVFENVVVSENTSGLTGGSYALIRGCGAYSNASAGVTYGLLAEQGSVIENSVSAYNSAGSQCYGISAANGGNIRGCTSQRNTSANGVFGIRVANGLIDDCVSACNTGGTASAYGILAFFGGHISNCRSTQNGSTAGTCDGISMTSGYGSILDCTSSGNLGSGTNSSGINVDGGSTVARCTVESNGRNGIRAGGNCQIRDNNCSYNGAQGTGYGIDVYGSGSRIDGNVADGNRIGIVAGGSRNIFTRNTTMNNVITEYAIGAGNSPATITNVTSSAFLVTDPWANFIH